MMTFMKHQPFRMFCNCALCIAHTALKRFDFGPEHDKQCLWLMAHESKGYYVAGMIVVSHVIAIIELARAYAVFREGYSEGYYDS
jgi:hypothetical protein